MKFTKAEPTIDLHPRYTSENERWEIGVYPVQYGFRVRAGLVNGCCYEIDYCAGGDQVFLGQLLAVVIRILESYPESIKPYELDRVMPTYRIKPINLDPTCWKNLQALAAAAHPHA